MENKIQSILNEINLEGTNDLMNYDVEELNEIVFEIIDTLKVDLSSYGVDENSDGKYVVFIEDRAFDLNAWDSPKYLVESICNSINMEEA